MQPLSFFQRSRPGRGAPSSNPQVTALGDRPVWLMLAASLWIASIANFPLWRTLWNLPEINHLRGVLFSLGFGVIIASATMLLLSLLNWRWTLKPAIALFLVSASAGMYFMLTYSVVIDPSMMVNALQTDVRETRDLLSFKFALMVLFVGVLPAVLLWRRPVRQVKVLRRVGGNALTLLLSLLVAGGTLLAVYQDFSSLMRNRTEVRYLINPLNSFYALASLGFKQRKLDNLPLQAFGADAQVAPPAAGTKPPMLLLVLGETGRAGNYGINGYERQTTPGLMSLSKENLVTWRNAWSCGTSTAASVPCMFSGMGKTDFESRKGNFEGLMDVLQRSGLAVVWLDNQSGCKGVCDRVPNFNTRELQVPGLCTDGECYDEVMLQQLPQRLAELPAERKAKGVVVVFHQMGSHGPAYYKRSPPDVKQFSPECTTNQLQECEKSQVVNAYDNSVLYTDRLLTRSVEWLKKQEGEYAPAMMFVADHGESLGENNLYLHGLPYAVAPDVQKRVPWITWMSPAFVQTRQLSTDCLRQSADNRVTHDSYFHSVLGLMEVQTATYQSKLDMFATCTGTNLTKTSAPTSLNVKPVVFQSPAASKQ